MILNKEESKKQDIDLIELIKVGNDDAFHILYHKYNRYIMYLCLKLTQNQADAEDLTQDVFIKMLIKIKEINGSTLKQFLNAVTFSKIKDYRNKRTNEKKKIAAAFERENMQLRLEKSALRNIIDKEFVQKGTEAIEGIENEEVRKCAKGKYVLNLNNKEIADSIGKSNQRVAEHLYEARLILRRKLEKYL